MPITGYSKCKKKWFSKQTESTLHELCVGEALLPRSLHSDLTQLPPPVQSPLQFFLHAAAPDLIVLLPAFELLITVASSVLQWTHGKSLAHRENLPLTWSTCLALLQNRKDFYVQSPWHAGSLLQALVLPNVTHNVKASTKYNSYFPSRCVHVFTPHYTHCLHQPIYHNTIPWSSSYTNHRRATWFLPTAAWYSFKQTVIIYITCSLMMNIWAVANILLLQNCCNK